MDDTNSPSLKILKVTCNNVLCNDVMVEELTKQVPNFSVVNHTRCFLRIVNLCTKLIIKQFNILKKKEDEHLDEDVMAVTVLPEVEKEEEPEV